MVHQRRNLGGIYCTIIGDLGNRPGLIYSAFAVHDFTLSSAMSIDLVIIRSSDSTKSDNQPDHTDEMQDHLLISVRFDALLDTELAGVHHHGYQIQSKLQLSLYID